MRAVREAFFPGDEPEIEVIDGRRVPKMSPKRRHGRTQAELTFLLLAWARGRGEVANEWRFHVSGVRSRRDSYVPDIAYVAKERLAELSPDDREEPPFPPDVAIEIRSPADRETNIATKVERYLAFGATLVLDVRPLERTIVAYDARGARRFEEGDTFAHPAMPEFAFSLRELFDRVDPA